MLATDSAVGVRHLPAALAVMVCEGRSALHTATRGHATPCLMRRSSGTTRMPCGSDAATVCVESDTLIRTCHAGPRSIPTPVTYLDQLGKQYCPSLNALVAFSRPSRRPLLHNRRTEPRTRTDQHTSRLRL